VKPERIALTLILGSRGSWPARAEMLRRAVQDPAVQGGEWSMAQVTADEYFADYIQGG